MEWMPALRIGWRNGWIFPVLLSLTDAVLFRLFPQEVVTRLFDRSGWSRRQIVFTALGKVCGAVCLALLALTPLKLRSPVLVVGSVVAAVGLAGLVRALFDFRNTPAGEPVTRGMYAISRHPQIVMSSLVLLGGCLAIGSWGAAVAWLAARVLSHFGILAEEEVCLRLYGESYRNYLQSTPRYLLFF